MFLTMTVRVRVRVRARKVYGVHDRALGTIQGVYARFRVMRSYSKIGCGAGQERFTFW